MATTRIMSLHVSKGKTASQCIRERLDYIMNPDKTEGGALVSTYACAQKTAASEFMLFRNEYLMRTGRDIPNEVIGYHVRQAFKPGEITAEEANKIGKELAAKLSGDRYAYVVATHDDRKHIHNHIIICSFPVDGTYKYRDLKKSAKDLARMSDELCQQHGLSVIQDQQNKTVTYDKWLGNKKEITNRDNLRMIIDTALRLNPDGFDALMQLMEEAGCLIKSGAQISIKPPNAKRYIRLDSLGAEYTEDALRKVLEGKHIHIPKTPRHDYTESQIKRLVDIEAKLCEGKGKGYMVWAERNNIDAKAQSIIYLKENHISSIAELNQRITALRSERNHLNASIRRNQNRMKEINELRKAIRDYRRTKDVYTHYRESGWSLEFYQEHRREIEAHKQAQEMYSMHDGKMPTLKDLSAEYDTLREQKSADVAAVEKLKPQLTTLNHIKYNFDILEQDCIPASKERHREQKPER